MKRKYEAPEIEIDKFAKEEVIVTSGITDPDIDQETGEI
jgi:hypothetical protein